MKSYTKILALFLFGSSVSVNAVESVPGVRGQGVKINGEDYEIYLNGCDFCLKITENGFSSYPWLK